MLYWARVVVESGPDQDVAVTSLPAFANNRSSPSPSFVLPSLSLSLSLNAPVTLSLPFPMYYSPALTTKPPAPEAEKGNHETTRKDRRLTIASRLSVLLRVFLS